MHPDKVYIFDDHSTDGIWEYLEQGYNRSPFVLLHNSILSLHEHFVSFTCYSYENIKATLYDYEKDNT